MPINGVVTGKLQLLDATLGNLRSLGLVTSKQIENDWRLKMTIERALQILVENVIDICQHILAESGQTPGTSGRDAIERCVQLGVLSSTDPFLRMIQFRNFVVHLYERVEPLFLADILVNHLGDFERFRDEVLIYAGKSDASS